MFVGFEGGIVTMRLVMLNVLKYILIDSQRKIVRGDNFVQDMHVPGLLVRIVALTTQ